MPDEAEILRIGEWRVDPNLDELSREGQTVRLEPQPMRLLLYLAAHAGRVIDLQELLDQVWPNVVVTPGSVYQAIAQLRRILGDVSEHPSYIENLPRRGYRLIAPVAPWGAVPKRPMDTGTPDTGLLISSPPPPLAERSRRTATVLGAIALPTIIIGSIVALAIWRTRELQVASAPTTANAQIQVTAAPGPPAARPSKPPAHSIAVLAFTNFSGDVQQEYLSDGVSEELINALSHIEDLRVSARTSSFAFKGQNTDVRTIARELNVATVLEGSVRRSNNTVRISAQLIDAQTGFHLWSNTYDRDLGDVLKLQTEIAGSVAGALKVTLLGAVAERIELGGTHNSAAFDAYLRGSKAFNSVDDASKLQSAITEYSQAIRLDPSYAHAFAGRSRARSAYAAEFAGGPAVRQYFDAARADARKALQIAPDSAEAHLALASCFGRGSLDFTHANEAYEHALALAPGNAEVLAESGRFAVIMGHFDVGLAAGRRAVALDPLGARSRYLLGQALRFARRDGEALAAFTEVISLEPNHQAAYGLRGLTYYSLGEFESARSSCESNPGNWASLWCLAVTNRQLGRNADAQAMLNKLRLQYGDAGPVEYATIYAQWGDTAKALEWLAKAVQLRNQDLVYVKTEPLLDPLRNEPQFQAMERELNFPN